MVTVHHALNEHAALRRALAVGFLSLLVLLGACTRSEVNGGSVVQGLSPRETLIRASLDLRGVRPLEEEYRRIEEDPGALEAVIASFVDDPRFEARVRDVFAPAFRTRVEYSTFQQGDVRDASLGEEPLVLIGRVAMEDRPYTDIVESDTSFADAALLEKYALTPVDGDEAVTTATGTTWRRARYVDGRPPAGVLSLTALAVRYPTSDSNLNRGRANAVSRALLCQDLLSRPVDFPRDANLSSAGEQNAARDSLENAVRDNVACQACHATLDPMASAFFGFAETVDPTVDVEYLVEAEQDWRSATGIAPGYFGSRVGNLTELGQQIAADPRFVSCAVKRVYEGLLGRSATVDDDGALAVHREAFLAGGLRLKPLFLSVLKDPAYRGRAAVPPFGGQPAPVARKLMAPEVLSTMFVDLTGYTLTSDGIDLLMRDDDGLRSLAGGVDGRTGTGASRGPSVSILLVHERLAEAGARFFVDDDSRAAVPTVLSRALSTTDFSAEPRAEDVVRLHVGLFGIELALDDAEVRDAIELWRVLFEEANDARVAWAGMLSAFLRDPELVTY